jgi:hypothetical protein
MVSKTISLRLTGGKVGGSTSSGDGQAECFLWMPGQVAYRGIEWNILLQIPVVVAHSPQLYSVYKYNSKSSRVGIPLEPCMLAWISKTKLAVSKAISLKEHHV